MPTSEIVLPWRSLSSLSLEVDSLEHYPSASPVEGARLDVHPEYGDPSIDVCEVENWGVMRLGLRATTPAGELAGVCGPNEDSAKALLCRLVLSCSATKVRRAVELARVEPGVWVGELDIHRSELAATATIQVRVVRAFEGVHNEPGIAEIPGAVLGESARLRLLIDRWARPYNGPLLWKWIHFSESGDSWLATRTQDLFFVDATDAPTVFLNLDIPEFQVVLDSKARQGPAALLRDTVAIGIACAAWQQLILTSLLYPKLDEESGGYEIGNDWRGAVARFAAEQLFPGKDDSQAISEFRSAFGDEDQRPLLLARVTAAAQHAARSGREFERCAKVAAKTGDAT